ncbi:MAG TPA: PHP domain-containing protein [Jatrophihabitans sp.]
MLIDLHAHSTASDGTDDPGALVRAAAAAGLDVIAITDHDTTAGWASALAARPAGLTVVRGAEFSCVYEAPGAHGVNLHLLGYLFDPAHPGLLAEQGKQHDARTARARRMVARLVADGYPISWQQVEELAAGGPVGRPHVARALVQAGVAPSVDAVFADLLAHTSTYHVGKRNTDVLEMIRLIRDAGGVTVFAHPLAWRRGPVVDDAAIRTMTEAGLQGIERDHPDHDAESRAHIAALGGELGLVLTGASDYHGSNKTHNDLGICTTSTESYEALLAFGTALPPVSD